MFYCLFLGGHFNRGIGLSVGGAYVFERLSCCCHLHSLNLLGVVFCCGLCFSFVLGDQADTLAYAAGGCRVCF